MKTEEQWLIRLTSIYFHHSTHRNQFPSDCWFIVCIFFVCGMLCLAVILILSTTRNQTDACGDWWTNTLRKRTGRIRTEVSYNCLDVKRNVNGGTELGIKCFASGQYNLWLVNLCVRDKCHSTKRLLDILRGAERRMKKKIYQQTDCVPWAKLQS